MGVADHDSMLAHLGAACRAARLRARRKQIHIAVALDVSEGTVRHFELGHRWPQNPDRTIRAYADEVGVTPHELWEDALRRWRDE